DESGFVECVRFALPPGEAIDPLRFLRSPGAIASTFHRFFNKARHGQVLRRAVVVSACRHVLPSRANQGNNMISSDSSGHRRTVVSASAAGLLTLLFALATLMSSAAAAVVPQQDVIASKALERSAARRPAAARTEARPASVGPGISGWSTGSCPSLLPGPQITRPTPGSVDTRWASLEQQA